jgi:hypothetical protein
MIAPDRVVMRDSSAIRNHGVERCAFDCEPLRLELARLAEQTKSRLRNRHFCDDRHGEIIPPQRRWHHD